VTQSQLYNALLALLGTTNGSAVSETVFVPPTQLNAAAARARLRLLLVEDNEVNQQVALNMLARAGLAADLAVNGVEALSAVQSRVYDLVLMDVHMPELDGLEATRQIRALGGMYEQLPIVAMTANALEGDRQTCLNAGMDDYLAKPFKPEGLLDVIRRNLRGEAALQAVLPVVADGPATGVGAVKPAVPLAAQPDIPLAELDQLLPLDIAASRARAGDEEFWKMLLEAYLDDVPKRLNTLRLALDARDLPLAVKEAHTLKGSSAELCAEPLRQLAYAAEQLGKAGQLEEMRSLHAQLLAAHERLKEFVDEQIEGIPAITPTT
jgi:CheY-like chemotaxis protein